MAASNSISILFELTYCLCCCQYSYIGPGESVAVGIGER